jgi:hypothetical protein
MRCLKQRDTVDSDTDASRETTIATENGHAIHADQNKSMSFVGISAPSQSKETPYDLIVSPTSIPAAERQHPTSEVNLPIRSSSNEAVESTDGALSILLVDDNPVNLRVSIRPRYPDPVGFFVNVPLVASRRIHEKTQIRLHRSCQWPRSSQQIQRCRRALRLHPHGYISTFPLLTVPNLFANSTKISQCPSWTVQLRRERFVLTNGRRD